LPAVQRVKAIVALLLVVLWPLAASHCALENLPSLDFLACAEGGCCEPHPESDAKGDNCTVVESGFYKTQNGRLTVPAPPALLLCLIELPVVVSVSFAASHVIPESSPPELPQLWRFSERTALPPRAPSFVS